MVALKGDGEALKGNIEVFKGDEKGDAWGLGVR